MRFHPPPYTCEGYIYDPEVDDQDDDGRYYYNHVVTCPDGRDVRMPTRSHILADKDEFEAWVRLGRPCGSAAKVLTGDEYFGVGALEWLADIQKAHNVAQGDWQTLAVLARLYGDSGPEIER